MVSSTSRCTRVIPSSAAQWVTTARASHAAYLDEGVGRVLLGSPSAKARAGAGMSGMTSVTSSAITLLTASVT